MILEEVEKFFGDDSPLRCATREDGAFKYEPRIQQVEMARAVASAMDDRENLCVEAPTGVGKTFAYLVPAVLMAKKTGKAVIVSTHTINLQEQIITRDIPMLQNIMNCSIDAVVAKGRSNYLCLRRLNSIIEMDQELLALDGVNAEIIRLRRWAGTTHTGDYSELPHGISHQLWKMVCCERGNCLGKDCDYFKRCHLQRARRAIQEAEIIISNHAKFFTALVAEEAKLKLESQLKNKKKEDEKILPDFSAVILDEGHTIEDCASDHLGLRADSYTIRTLLLRLFNNDRKTGVLADNCFSTARAAVIECTRMSDMFFTRLIEWMEPQNQNPLRYEVPNHIQNYLGPPMERVVTELQKAIVNAPSDEASAELQSILFELDEQKSALEVFFTMSEPDYVYWFEREGRNKEEVSLNVVPIDVAPGLSEILFSKSPVIVASATLAVNGNIDYFKKRIGCQNARSLILDTPFDYEKQVELYLAGNMPDPYASNKAFIAEAAKHIEHFLRQTKGCAFVLFTSYKMINDVSELLETFFKKEKYTLLKQGDDLSPRKMLEEFRNTPNSVIFGTSSFWSGVDVPGDALSNVIIVRLPFAVPSHPLIKARTERVDQISGSAFFNYSVPEAVLKFRQGFGRLIRTRDDKGIVVILDSRVVSKSYGRIFLDSIPHCPRQIF